MKNTWTLSKALIKNNYPLNKKTVTVFVVLAVCLLPALFQLYAYYSLLIEFGLTTQAVQVALLISCAFGSFTVLFSFPTVFYFAKDTKTLLALPVTPMQIVTAKMVMIYLSQIVLDFVFTIPLWIAWARLPFNLVSWIFLIFESLTIVFVPLLVIAIFVLVAMRIMPFFRNRDRFNLVFSLLSLLLVVVVSFSSGFFSSSTMLENADFASLSAIQVPAGPFFQIPLAVQAIINGDWIALLFGILIIIALGAVFWVCAANLYLPVVVNISQSSSKVRSKIKARSPKLSYMWAEYKLLMRSPSYLTNMVLAAFIIPVLITGMLIYFVFYGPEELPVELLFPYVRDLGIMFIAGTILGLFSASTSTISSTAISRMGQSLSFYKSLPLTMQEQIRLNTLLGFLIGYIPQLVFLVFLYFMKAGILSSVVFAGGLFLSSLLTNLIGIGVDCFHPKLVWDDETAAIKNNLNGLFTLVFCWLLIVLVVLLFWGIGLENYQIASWILLGLMIILNIVLWFWIPSLGSGFLKNKS